MYFYENQIICYSEFDENFNIEMKTDFVWKQMSFLSPTTLTILSIHERPLPEFCPIWVKKARDIEGKYILCYRAFELVHMPHWLFSASTSASYRKV